MEKIVPFSNRSKLEGIYSPLGWITGFLSVLFAKQNGFFSTLAAIDTFTKKFYMEQIVFLQETGNNPEVMR